jgi:hypothetical protein
MSKVAPVIAVFVMRWMARAAMSAGPTTRPIGGVVRACSRRSSIWPPGSEAGAVQAVRVAGGEDDACSLDPDRFALVLPGFAPPRYPPRVAGWGPDRRAASAADNLVRVAACVAWRQGGGNALAWGCPPGAFGQARGGGGPPCSVVCAVGT